MSNKDLKIDVDQLVLEQVQIEKASVFHPENFDPTQIVSFIQNVEHEMALNEVDRHYRVRLSFSIKTKMKDDSTPASGEFVLQFFFLVKNMQEWITSSSDSNLTVDGLLASTLAGISYSTARGVLLTRFQGTAFQNVILPIVSPIQMLGVN
ncbi:MAG: hypothetical protein AAGJ93_12350 [Bacteroidota bacterium]